jgi:16S rRNA (guanine966-N2)-methyltransferase
LRWTRKPYSIPPMRITGGELAGRQLVVPQSGVRPTQDRVRAALFSMLAATVPGCRFLDLYAGSGAVGIEAWSRDAAHVCWVEINPRVLTVLRTNVTTLCGAERTQVIGMDARRFLRGGPVSAPFDVVFCDPPYLQGTGRDAERGMLLLLSGSNVLADNGLVVIERADEELTGAVAGWKLSDDRRYGGTRLRFWRPARAKAEG